jgi:hypothetical protein
LLALLGAHHILHVSRIRVKCKGKTSTLLHLEHSFVYGTETRKFQKENQKYLKSSEIWSWRKMQKVIWTDHVRNEKVLQRVKEERNVLRIIKRRNAN